MLADWTLLTSPAAIAAIMAAVTMVGLSKGGLGASAGLLAMPLLAMFMSPVTAAALMLPVLLMMDAVSLRIWWGKQDGATVRLLLQGAMVGIGIGALTAAFTSDAVVRLLVGLVALGHVARTLLSAGSAPRAPGVWRGRFWGTVSGFTSFVAHAGGPPFQFYALPLRLPPQVYTATSVTYFAIINLVKVIPYAALGQFEGRVLATSALMLPVAALATLAGAWIVKRMKPSVFYPFITTMVAIAGTKLVWDGVTELAGF